MQSRWHRVAYISARPTARRALNRGYWVQMNVLYKRINGRPAIWGLNVVRRKASGFQVSSGLRMIFAAKFWVSMFWSSLQIPFDLDVKTSSFGLSIFGVGRHFSFTERAADPYFHKHTFIIALREFERRFLQDAAGFEL